MRFRDTFPQGTEVKILGIARSNVSVAIVGSWYLYLKVLELSAIVERHAMIPSHTNV